MASIAYSRFICYILLDISHMLSYSSHLISQQPKPTRSQKLSIRPTKTSALSNFFYIIIVISQPSMQQPAPPHPPPTWTCCECKSTNLSANATRCPMSQCAHDRCRFCRSGPPSPRLGSPGPLFSSSRPLQSFSPSFSQYPYTNIATPTNFPIPRPYEPSQPSAPPRHYALSALSPPPGPRRDPYYNSGGPTSASGQAWYTYSEESTCYASPPRTVDSGIGRASLPSSARPSTLGWWKCCQDGHWNNPDLCPVMCATDGHRKCSRCRVLE